MQLWSLKVEIMNYIKIYNDKLQSGEIVACEEIKSVYARLVKEMGDDSFPFYFRESAGQRAIDFIEGYCKHFQGDKAGQFVRLELFQKAFIQNLFGWLERDTNRRRFREYFLKLRENTERVSYLDALRFICSRWMAKQVPRYIRQLQN